MNAYTDLTELLDPDEKLEGIVFGPWGWGSWPRDDYNDDDDDLGFGEPERKPVPHNEFGKLHDFTEEVIGWMDGWSFYGGYGSPECYAMRAWSSHRVFWVTQYDGATSIDYALRHPQPCQPDMPGG